MAKILIIEDEATVRDTLAFNLKAEDYEVITASDGAAGLRLARDATPDLVILDLMLPELDGLTLCRMLRRDSSVPIIMLTARGTEIDKIAGLETGADDYVVKPFSLGELLARVRANLRRSASATRASSASLQAGDLVMDLLGRRASLGGVEIRLTQREFDLLAELLRNRGAVLSRDLLLARVWGYEYGGGSHTVDVHVRWLREKIEQDPSAPVRITTVRGVGYRFEG
jgi:DNA-binding response OmpR family regulator